LVFSISDSCKAIDPRVRLDCHPDPGEHSLQ
jgi:hypothetical protein